MSEFRMPSLGADMEAGILVEWSVKPGDHVQRGDIVAVVETDKGAIEVEIFEDGVIGELLVHPGAKVPVGTPLARVDGAEGPATPRTPAPPVAAPAAPPPVAHPAAPSPPSPSTRASPAARRRARELGLDVAAVAGSGPDGAVVLADLEPAPAAPREAPPREDAEVRRQAMRRAIAAAMSRSKREIPHYYLSHEIDLHSALSWLERANAERPVTQRFVYAALLLKAVAAAAQKIPEINGFYEDGSFRQAERIHLGVGISLRGGGLVSPALHDVDRLPILELMSALSDLVDRARSGRLRSSELTDATLTVTNLGPQGVSTVFPVIYPPQVAIVGFGRVTDRAWPVDGSLQVRPVISATLGADHRVTDGHRGGLFLRAVDRALQRLEET